jgi:hypothetical protein
VVLVLGAVDHYTALLINKPRGRLVGELVYMDSFNQAILELHRPADRWAYAMETGHLWDTRRSSAAQVRECVGAWAGRAQHWSAALE